MAEINSIKAGERTLTIREVKLNWIADENPDLSWLDQTDDEMGEGFEKQSVGRKESYGQTWEMLGCVARAVVAYPLESNIGTRLQAFTSGGLWEIESDSDEGYLRAIEDEQLIELAEHLSHFGISTTAQELRDIATA
jgi:hypothetical protein